MVYSLTFSLHIYPIFDRPKNVICLKVHICILDFQFNKNPIDFKPDQCGLYFIYKPILVLKYFVRSIST
jgi:hypothetical protein